MVRVRGSIFLGLDEVMVFGDNCDVFDSCENQPPNQLCVIPPRIDWNFKSLDSVLMKVVEIKNCVGVSCARFDDQFKELLIAIEAGQPSLARSTAKKNRGLITLLCFVNYKGRGGSAFRPKGKERAANGLL